MIGIEIITGRLEASFGPRLEAFFNEYPNAEILCIKMRGIEGGKGMIAILKYNKKEELPKPQPMPKPKKPEKIPEELEVESKRAELEKLKAELGE